MRKQTNRKGFTLIELLVVIAIIALLLSILVPSLAIAKERTQSILCRSNLRQYGLAMTMYLDDYDSYFPTTDIWLKSSGKLLYEGDEPDGVFWPYISSFDIHLCPAFLKSAKGTEWAESHENLRGSYVMSSYLGNNGSIWSNWLGVGVTGVKKFCEVHRPSGVTVFTEENPWKISNYSEYPFNDLFFTVGNSSRYIDNFATFHNPPGRDRESSEGGLNAGLANLVFADGSVSSVPRAKTDEDLDRNFRLCWPKSTVR